MICKLKSSLLKKKFTLKVWEIDRNNLYMRLLLLLLPNHITRVWLWDLIDGSPPGSSIPGIHQARILEWVAISISNGYCQFISGSSAFSKSNLNIWKVMVQVLLKPGLENVEHYFTSMWDECNCVIVWTFFDVAFLWDWNENWSFPVLWPLLIFPNLLVYLVQHFQSIIF